MTVLGGPRSSAPLRSSNRGWLLASMLSGLLLTACDHTFEPFDAGELGLYSIFGYLDLNADTQWVRVMPIRESLFLDPDPIDVTVTLEQVGSGQVVTLRDSLFSFQDQNLGRAVYAHNFWTTHRLVAGASYQVKAVGPDGVVASAVVAMPGFNELIFRSGNPNFGNILLRGINVVFIDVWHLMRDTASDMASIHPVPQKTVSLPLGYVVRGDSLNLAGYVDLQRAEIDVVLGLPDWPFDPDLSDLEVSVPGKAPSNVEGGIGYVGGLSRFTIPFHGCEVLAPRPGKERPCDITYNAQTASISGRVMRQCGSPRVLAAIRLREEFPGGGAIVRVWKTGLEGEYRFEGIEPGSRLTLDLGGYLASFPAPLSSGSPPVSVASLAPGQQQVLGDIITTQDC